MELILADFGIVIAGRTVGSCLPDQIVAASS